MDMKKTLPLVIGVAILVGGASFFGGMKFAQAKGRGGRPANFPAANGQNAMYGGTRGAGNGTFRAGGPGGPGGGFVSGDILSNDGKTLTIKMRDGGSKIVLLGDSTEVSKFVAGAASDLEVGKTVMVVGKTNSDGSVTATTVQLRPPMPTPPPGGKPGEAPTPAPAPAPAK